MPGQTISAPPATWQIVGERVRRRRNELGLTQKEASNRSRGRISLPVWSILENARQKGDSMEVESLRGASTALDLPERWLEDVVATPVHDLRLTELGMGLSRLTEQVGEAIGAQLDAIAESGTGYDLGDAYVRNLAVLIRQLGEMSKFDQARMFIAASTVHRQFRRLPAPKGSKRFVDAFRRLVDDWRIEAGLVDDAARVEVRRAYGIDPWVEPPGDDYTFAADTVRPGDDDKPADADGVDAPEQPDDFR